MNPNVVRRRLLHLPAALAAATWVRPAPAQEHAVRLGVIGISFHAVVGGAVEILFDRLGQPYELTQGPHDRLFEALGRGEVDLLVAAWLPGTHAHLSAPLEGRIESLASVYRDARLFWSVPAYVPVADVRSIADLRKPEVAARMERRIPSIGPSAGLSVRSAAALKAYGLDGVGYSLEPGETSRWVATFRDRHDAGAWQVMPLWQPQFLNRTHTLRVLDDPLQTLGGADDAVIVASSTFVSRASPRVIRALRKVRLGIDAVTDMDLAVNLQGLAPKSAAQEWLSRHPHALSGWMA